MPAGGVMQGMSRLVSGGRAVSTEFIMILEHEGQWVFRAMPSGQATTDFSLVESGASTVRFGNPAHDFPQLIEYILQSGGSGQRMLAVISGGEGESQRRMEFRMIAISCDVLMQASQATR